MTTYIEPDLELFLEKLNKLTADTKPLWGKMTAQQMVEHLSDILDISIGVKDLDLEIPVDKVGKAQEILASDKAIPKNFKASFVPDVIVLRNEELPLAIDEFVDKWFAFEEFYEEHPGHKQMHPYYGELNYDQWLRLHSKHFSHHFEQFGLL